MNDELGNLFKSLLFILVVILVLLVISFILPGCRANKTAIETATITRHDTVRVDSVVIRDRIVPIEVQLPGSTQYVEVNISHDTTSVLEDGLYRSTAAVRDGKLLHSLATKRGAKLTAKAHVQDTLRTSRLGTNNDNLRTVYKTEIKEVNRLYKWQKFLMCVGALALMGAATWLFTWLKR